VIRLARESGRRESRYAHLFSGDVSGVDESEAEDRTTDRVDGISPGGSRISQLEARVAGLEAETAELKRLLQALTRSETGG
jgi:uncharacterized protein YceH (UPF0502 family)